MGQQPQFHMESDLRIFARAWVTVGHDCPAKRDAQLPTLQLNPAALHVSWPATTMGTSSTNHVYIFWMDSVG